MGTCATALAAAYCTITIVLGCLCGARPGRGLGPAAGPARRRGARAPLPGHASRERGRERCAEPAHPATRPPPARVSPPPPRAAGNGGGTLGGIPASPADKAFSVLESLGAISCVYTFTEITLEIADTLRQPPPAAATMRTAINVVCLLPA